MTDFGTFRLGTVIMHTVPRGTRPADGPDRIEYSEAPIDLLDAERTFIQERLRLTLGGMARPVIEDPELESVTPDLLRGLTAGTTDFVSASGDLARALHGRQRPVSPIGLLMLIEGEVDSEACIVIAKLEREEGLRVEQTTTSGGLRTYRAQYLHDLVLGQRTRVFKASVFKASGMADGSLVAGDVVDDQAGPVGAVADYFIDFLGCKFVQRPDRMTEQFFTETQRWIKKTTKGDPEKAAQYEIALLAEMQSQAPRVSPQDFARQCFEADDQDEYLTVIRSVSLPIAGFRKDTQLIKSQIRRIKVQTRRGASVFAPPSMHDDGSLQVQKVDGEASSIIITDEITSIGGAGGGKSSDGG